MEKVEAGICLEDAIRRAELYSALKKRALVLFSQALQLEGWVGLSKTHPAMRELREAKAHLAKAAFEAGKAQTAMSEAARSRSQKEADFNAS